MPSFFRLQAFYLLLWHASSGEFAVVDVDIAVNTSTTTTSSSTLKMPVIVVGETSEEVGRRHRPRPSSLEAQHHHSYSRLFFLTMIGLQIIRNVVFYMYFKFHESRFYITKTHVFRNISALIRLSSVSYYCLL